MLLSTKDSSSSIIHSIGFKYLTIKIRGVSCISSLKIIELGYNNNYTYRLEYIDSLGDR